MCAARRQLRRAGNVIEVLCADSRSAHEWCCRVGIVRRRRREFMRGHAPIVQQPNGARFESMPCSALEQVDVGYILPATEIGALLMKLAARKTEGERNAEPELRRRV